jgi:adenylate kinase family enzyme
MTILQWKLNMQRILIIGTSGSGKTTLAHILSRIKCIPSHDLDNYYWLPNWQHLIIEDFKAQIDLITQQDTWIIAGNYPEVIDLLWQQADTIIWLDYSFLRCFLQCLRRSLKRIFNKTPCCNGNYESFALTFASKDSVLLWIIHSYRRYKHKYNARFKSPPFKEEIRLRFSNPITLAAWLKQTDSCV